MSSVHRVFGAENSPFSVKVRSYFRYKGIPHEWIVRDTSSMEEYKKYVAGFNPPGKKDKMSFKGLQNCLDMLANLKEAKMKAKTEFQEVLASTGKKIDDIRAFVTQHPKLSSPLYKVPHRPGTTGIAANFVLHVSDLMAGNGVMGSKY